MSSCRNSNKSPSSADRDMPCQAVLGALSFTWLSQLVALGWFFATLSLCGGVGMWSETPELWDRKKNSSLVPASALSVWKALSVV